MKKKELKKVTPYTYKRVFDLTMFPAELLKLYGLEPAKYIYIGSSNIKPKYRTYRWKSHVKGRYSIDKNILKFLDAYQMLLEEQSDMTKEEIDKMLYETLEIVSRHNSKENAQKFESDLIGHYLILQATNGTRSIKDKVFILNSRGSSVKIKNGKVKFKRRLFLD